MIFFSEEMECILQVRIGIKKYLNFLPLWLLEDMWLDMTARRDDNAFACLWYSVFVMIRNILLVYPP